MQNMKLKKLVVACQAAAMTMATSVAVSTQASDTELYKAPTKSETTLLFMLDVSGSMADNGSYDGTSQKRIDRLKEGMLKLLKGDATTTRLPDNLSTGLSEFSGVSGRIKLEALPLDTPVTLAGTRQIYRQVERLSQPLSCSTTATQDTITPQERIDTRTQARTRTRTATQVRTIQESRTRDNIRTRTRNRSTSNWKPWGNWSTNGAWSAWSDIGTWSAWSDFSSFGNWGGWTSYSAWTSWSGYGTPYNTASSTTNAWAGGGACGNFTNNGSASVLSSVIEMCTEWQANNTTCATWTATNKTLAQIAYDNSSSSTANGAITGTVTQSGAVSNTTPPTATWTPSNPTASSSSAQSSTFNTVNSGTTSAGASSTYDPTPANTSDTNPPPATSGNTQTQTRTETSTRTTTDTNTQTETQTDTATQTRTQTSNTVTARQTRTDTTTATRADTRTTIYTGTATSTHRYRMIDAVNALSTGGSTPTAYAYAEAAAYLMGKTTKGLTSSGFSDSNNKAAIQDGNNYLAPSRVSSANQCNTQGIYFLTDGEPNYGSNSGNYTNFMTTTLSPKSFSCSTNQLITTNNSWGCIGNYAKALLNPANNPAGVVIKTAVVGFGSDFSGAATTNSDVENAKKWGEVGQGGWYPGQSSADVVDSVKRFLKKLQKYIPPVTTGSVTIPVDNLDTQNIQPWGYFPQFDPRPDLKVTTWVGNLKKYQVVNNALKDKDGADVMITSGTEKGQSVDNPNDYWADQNIMREITKVKQVNGIDVEETLSVRVGGALSRLLLGSSTTTGDDPVTTERKIFTDRKLALAVDNTTYVAQPINSGNLIQVKTADLKTNNTDNNFSVDSKRGYVAALFGYDVGADVASSLTDETNTTFNNFLNNTNATLRQMGAVMHSKPILITQKGTTKYDEKTETISYDDRDDLIAFGTTQGVLHVVRAGKSATDNDAGKEVFAFVPSEMIDRQAESFIGQQDDPNATLHYGIDGQWTAYTEYTTKKGAKTNEPVVSVASSNGGKQWLYGGLRMGGKSYYSLDLSDVTSGGGTPKLKFRINPTGTCSSTNGLGCMGQSWSKPTITWVNWQGKRKLVMLVGGGYDSIYESSADYSPSSGYTDQGAGVYMFDADDGSLLWWASANAGSDNTSTNKTYEANMKRSVVSGIKAVDRNSDGLADHLYFGDLGGQVWRVDLNASAKAGVTTDGENFATRVVRILDMSGATRVPRFYNAPTFTIHTVPSGSLFAAVSIGSGNLSYPMSATTNNDDAVYVVYDKDVTRRNLPVLTTSELYTQDVKPDGATGKNLVKNTNGNTETKLTNGGWYYPTGTQKRILNEAVAIDSDLYVSIFDSSKDITATDCKGGVRGESNASQFCLPYGVCQKKNADGTTSVVSRSNDIFLGKGNIGISFGGINRDRGMVLNLPPTETLKKYTGKTKFISQRWYER
ncbi:PilC/PilY family type IV pilus protein [Acinetobacter sp.]|uniref:PilC/PilY family type IV pilus protein n=1 Tax=Acinetobacter sp. TaxID=472 RepID=UPI002FDA76BE